MGDIETFAKSTEKQSRSPAAYYFIVLMRCFHHASGTFVLLRTRHRTLVVKTRN